MANQNEKINPDNILIFGTTSEEIANAVEALSKEKNVNSVRLENKVIDDYIIQQSNAENKPISVDEFTADKENQRIAEEKALTLWNMMTNNATTDKAFDRIFTKSEIVQKTTLTNKTLGELLELLSLFGFIVFTKGRYEFKFIFGEETRKAEAYADIIETLSALNVNIARYKNLHKDETEQNSALDELRNNLKELIKI